jgi:hypothetical protein
MSKLRQQDSILLKKAGGLQMVSVTLFFGTSIEREHIDEMLNERIVWAAVSERTCYVECI